MEKEAAVMGLEAKIETYRKKRIIKEQFDRMRREANEALDQAERELVDAMLDQDLSSVRDARGVLFTVAPKLFVSCTIGNRDTVLDWLTGLGHDRRDVAREELVKTRVKEIVAQVIETQGVDKIPPELNVDMTPGISVTGWKAGK